MMIKRTYNNQSRCRRLHKLALSWCAALLFASLPAHTIAESSGASEYAIKAAIIFKIAKFVSWPEDAFSGRDEPLSVCVGRDDPIAAAMSALSGKSIHGRELSVQYFDDSLTVSGDCQVLFLSNARGKHQSALLNATSGRPILTIGENDQFISKGGIIGLEIKQNRIQFAINVSASESAGLDISAQLLQLAKITGSRQQQR